MALKRRKRKKIYYYVDDIKNVFCKIPGKVTRRKFYGRFLFECNQVGLTFERWQIIDFKNDPPPNIPFIWNSIVLNDNGFNNKIMFE